MRKSSLNTVYAYKRLRQFRKEPPARRSSQVRTVLQSQLSAMKFFGLKKKSLGPLRTLIDTKKLKKYFLWLLVKFLRFWPTVSRLRNVKKIAKGHSRASIQNLPPHVLTWNFCHRFVSKWSKISPNDNPRNSLIWELWRGSETFKKWFLFKTAWLILLDKTYVVDTNEAIPKRNLKINKINKRLQLAYPNDSFQSSPRGACSTIFNSCPQDALLSWVPSPLTNRGFTIIRVFLEIYHSQYTWVFYNTILFITLRFLFVSCQCYSFIRHSTLRSSFVLVRNFRLCAISLCDFQLFPVFDSHTCAYLHCEVHLILVIILAYTLLNLFDKITLTILLLFAIFQLLQIVSCTLVVILNFKKW